MHHMIRKLRVASYLSVALVFIAAPIAAAANTKIAQIKNVSGDTVIVRDGARTPATSGEILFEKDTIETGADGSIGLTFTDNTVMSAGPNSEIALEEYRFDSTNFNGAMLTDIRKGTLSMVSGDVARSSPGAMKVKTPTAILGVRGTRFAVSVEGEH
jgi:hypothetical protein